LFSNIRIIYTDELPHKIKAFTLKDSSDFYTIFLNSKLSYEQLSKSLKHELNHIRRNDFQGLESVEDVEWATSR